MINDKDSVQLSEFCFNVCEVLKTAVQGRDVDSLDESVRVALEDLKRCVDLPFLPAPSPNNSRVTREIERTLRRGANMPRTRGNKGKVEGQNLKIIKIHDTLNAPSVPLDGTLSPSEHVPNLAPANSHKAATASGSGTPSARLRQSCTEY